MKQYKINVKQYHIMPTYIGKKQTVIARAIGMAKGSFSRNLNEGNFRVRDALSICNTQHLLLSDFITTEDVPVIGAFRQVDEWQTLSFSSSSLKRAITSGRITYTYIRQKTGFARPTIDTIIEGNCMIDQILKLCNAIGFNLRSFINDSTLPDIVTVQDRRMEVKELMRENELIQDELYKMERDYNRIKEENARLLNKIARLEHELNTSRDSQFLVAENTSIE